MNKIIFMRVILTSFLFVFFQFYGWAQEQTIKGIVKNESGDLLIGATVQVQGTKIGAVTDFYGKYTIKVGDASKSVLVFSYIGYETLEILVKKRSVINITLKESLNQLDEVVMIGYTTKEKKDLTGAIASADVRELSKVPVSNIAEALSGRVAGVQVQTTEGQPGADIRIRVRGGGSITQSNEPLYIIDGFPVEDGIGLLDPGEIESITVLKDASSTAIYGARGANGVILITTKQGKVQKAQVTINSYTGIRRITRFLDVLDAEGYVRLDYERTANDGLEEELDNWEKVYGPYSDITSNYSNRPGVNWQEEVFGVTALNQYHKIGIVGGTEQTKYNLAYSKTKIEGVMVNSGLEKDNISLNIKNKVSEKLNVSGLIRYSEQDVFGAGTSTKPSGRFNKLSQLIRYRPTPGITGVNEDILNSDIDVYQDGIEGNVLVNPIVESLGSHVKSEIRSLSMNTNLSYSINNYLTYSFNGGILRKDTRKEAFNSANTRAARNGGGPSGSIRHAENRAYSYTNLLRYKRKFKKHKLEVLLGQEEVYRYARWFMASSGQFPNDDIGLADLSQGVAPGIPESYEEDNRLQSFFWRTDYSFKNKYLFSATLRADGSTKFGSGNKFGYFPSASVAWRLVEEGFIDDLNVFSDFKLRFSYGASGNDRIANYRSLSLLTSQYYGLNNTLVNAVVPSTLPNPELKWETTYSRNLGIDLAFLNNRIQLTGELYHSNTKDLLLNSRLPLSSGFTNILKNVGETENKGIEVILNTRNITTKDFQWKTNFNISFNKNKVVSLTRDSDFFLVNSGSGGSSIDDFIVKVGEPVGLIYGFKTDGIYQVDDFNYDSDNQTYSLKDGIPFNPNFNPQPGSRKLQDISGPDGTPDGITDLNYDRTVIGNANPKHFGGISNTFIYKGFDLSIFMNWSYGNDVFNATKMAGTTQTALYRLNALGVVRNRWTNVNELGEVVKDPVQLSDLNRNASWSSYNGSGERDATVYDIFVEDGSFLRINNITLGYSLPDDVLEKLKISKLRLYGTINNLHTFTKYTGYDPDVSSRDNGGITPGIDWNAYPRSRQLIIGLNLSF